ncbi:Uncharacterised protein [[Pasteurella] mairii]|uniref:Uncharacterized protein n=1 Tax=[Pasteurella] mairii TaxID=757 RepID=A0A379B3S7_9PAST|nr:Uncharacterised protein [[Pasteurella] mairii]
MKEFNIDDLSLVVGGNPAAKARMRVVTYIDY